LLRGDYKTALFDFEILEKKVRDKSVPADATEIERFRLEIALLSSNINKSTLAELRLSVPLLQEVVRPEDVSEVRLESLLPNPEISGGAQLTSALVLARVLIAQGHLDSAEKWVSIVIEKARQEGYQPLLIQALFHHSGLQMKKRNSIAMKRSLEEARDLAKRLNLKVKQNCFEYVVHFLRSANRQSSPVKPLLDIFISNPNGSMDKEIVYLLNHYGFLSLQPIILENRDQVCNQIQGDEFWSLAFSSPILFWIPAEGVLFRRDSKGKGFLAEFQRSKALTTAVSAFFKEKMKLTLAEVHKLFSEVEYHPIRHESQARSMMTRLRVEFDKLEIKVERNESDGAYEAEKRDVLLQHSYVLKP
jgi:hypothetical protein